MEGGESSNPISLLDMVVLPYGDMNVERFAKHRAEELASLSECIEVPTGNRRVFQQLPRHMRRRTQSHCVKRVPRRLQEAHKRELGKSKKKNKKESKRPSRRHRRRPKQLLLDYNRRQRVFVWLETHVWHAKRFKMSSRWGYKIPLHPCDKTVRSCYRGATRTAFLQDVSYYCCFEIGGKKCDILTVIRQMTKQDTGLTLEAVRYDKGQYEGSVVLYRRNEYPYGAIGEVKFMWQPPQSSSLEDGNDRRSLWIWVHPCSYQEVLTELTEGFKLERVAKIQENDDPNPKDTQSEMEVEVTTEIAEKPNKTELLNDKAFVKLAPKLKPFYEHTPTYVSDRVTLKVLKDTLVRFRLAGQLSTAILSEVLREAAIESSFDAEKYWWQKLSSSFRESHSEQQKLWSEIRRAPIGSHLPPNCIIGLIVHDPREGLPMSRSKISPALPADLMELEFLPQRVTEAVSRSPLWDQTVRDEVTFSKITDQEMNELRSKHLVPGTPLTLEEKGSRIPVILIQNPGNGTSDVGIGWDVVLPAGWAMPFWIPLVYRNSRVGGYREATVITRQLGTPCFPEDFPDTTAGRMIEDGNRETLTDKYFKYPPDKRPNYIKLGILAPFHYPWKALVNEWVLPPDEQATVPENNEFFVLRERKILRLLQRFCDNRREQYRRRQTKTNGEIKLDDVVTQSNSRSLVGIRLKARSKGNLSEFGLVCLPLLSDIQTLSKDPHFVGPCESLHRDTTKKLRTKLKEDSKSARKKLKSADSFTPLEKEVMEGLGVDDHKKEIENLLIPDFVHKVVKSCSRDVIGFTKTGGFSLAEGGVTGLAFVALPALVRLLKESSKIEKEPTVLVRSSRSLQYRFANFTIL